MGLFTRLEVCVLLYVCLITQILDAVPQSATYACFHSASGNKNIQFELVQHDDTVTDVFSQQKWSTCSFSKGQVTGNGSTATPYSLTMDTVTDTPDCGVHTPETDIEEVVIIVQSQAILQDIDKKYTIRCNYTAIIEGTATSDPANIDSSNISPGTATSAGVATLELRDAATGDKIVSTTLGHQVKLYVAITDQYRATTFLRVEGCKAVAADGSKEVALLDRNGCDLTTVLGTSFSSADGFHAAETGEFSMFAFSTDDAISISCNLKFCYTAANACREEYICPAAGRRRRRSTEVKEAEISTKIVVCVPSETNQCPTGTNGNTANPNTKGGGSSLGQCFQNSMIVGGFATMGALLFLAIISTIFFCCQASKTHRRKSSR